MESFEVGACLWDFEAREFLTQLRETLVVKCKAPNGNKASFKSFRAGKATQLLKQNVQAPVIMDRAEWKHPKTMAKYADEDLIDPNKVLMAHMEKSDDEDEQDMKQWGFLGVVSKPQEAEAESPEPKAGQREATMGGSPEESVAQSPAVTVEQPEAKKKKIEVDDF